MVFQLGLASSRNTAAKQNPMGTRIRRAIACQPLRPLTLVRNPFLNRRGLAARASESL